MRAIFSHVPRENGFPQRPEAAIVRPKKGGSPAQRWACAWYEQSKQQYQGPSDGPEGQTIFVATQGGYGRKKRGG